MRPIATKQLKFSHKRILTTVNNHVVQNLVFFGRNSRKTWHTHLLAIFAILFKPLFSLVLLHVVSINFTKHFLLLLHGAHLSFTPIAHCHFSSFWISLDIPELYILCLCTIRAGHTSIDSTSESDTEIDTDSVFHRL